MGVTLDLIAREIRTSDSVVVLGAGASFHAGMPLAGQLAPLVWQALASKPTVFLSTAQTLGVTPTTPKETIGDEPLRIRAAFEQIAKDSEARGVFQRSMASLDRDRAAQTSLLHTALARLVHGGRVARVVSLNWDTLLETAFERRYGIDINSQGKRLWKPHGDCSRPDEPWVLPHEDGMVPDLIIADLTRLATERPRVLLVVGYSERDERTARCLVTPLGERWRVFRVSPSAVGEGALQTEAETALDALAASLVPEPETLGWEYVTFQNQRGLEAAINGERLGPRDVDACPRLPAFDSARRRMELLHYVELAGSPGSGKSITAWQLAREYNRQHFEVLRLAGSGTERTDAALRAPSSGWKRLLVVDDTQILPRHVVEQVAERAAPDQLIVLGTTDGDGETTGSVRIPAKASVAALAEAFKRRRDEVLPIVHRLDARVGDSFGALPFESRLADAAASESPWQFAFVLRGGWSHVRETLESLRDFDRADLLLLLIAARQLLSLDAGATMTDVAHDAEAIGRSADWANGGADVLRRHATVLPGLPLRCLHIRLAGVVVDRMLRDRKCDAFPIAVSALRRMVASTTSLRGIGWLLEHVLGSDGFRYRPDADPPFLTSEMLQELLRRALQSCTPTDRRDAAFLLARLIWYRELDERLLRPAFGTLLTWLASTASTEAVALGDLVNEMYNASKDTAASLVAQLDPTLVWARVATAQGADGDSWGRYLGRLAVAATPAWRDQSKQVLPRDRVAAIAALFRPTQLWELSEFMAGVASFDQSVALDAVAVALPALHGGFAADPLSAYQDTDALRRAVLGDALFTRRRASRAQRVLARKIVDSITPEVVARGIETCRFGDWESYARLLGWVALNDQRRIEAIVDALDWSQLERRATPFWERPPREFRLMLDSLAVGKTASIVDRWVLAHADRILHLDPIMCALSPATAVAVLRRGGDVNLGGHNGSDWHLQAFAISRLHRLDTASARAVLAANEAHVATALGKLQGLDSEQLPVFLRVVAGLEPAYLGRLCDAVEASAAGVCWSRALGQHGRHRRDARRVVRLVSDGGTGELKRLADELLASPRRAPRQVR